MPLSGPRRLYPPIDAQRTETEVPDGARSWLVAIVGAVAMVFTFGTPLSYGVFRAPLSDTYSISPVAMSGVFSVMLCTFFIGSGAVGVLATRIPVRPLLLACASATGLIAPALYVVDSYLGLAVVFGVLGLTLGTVYVLIASIVPRWFEERTGAATGLIFVGNGLGLFVLPPLWQAAFARLEVPYAFLLIMSVTAAAFGLAGIVCRRPAWVDQSAAATDAPIAWLVRVGRTRQFQLLFVGMGMAFAWYQLLAAYAVDLFASRGLTGAGASVAFGAIGGVSIISRIGSGVTADTIGFRRAFLLSLGCAAAGIGLLFSSLIPVLAAGVFLIGIGLGGAATLYIPLLMQTYHPKHDTAITGIMNVAAGIAALGMPPLGTALVVYTDGFAATIALTLATIAVGIWAVSAGTADPGPRPTTTSTTGQNRR
ncbi:MFS transporter [Natrialbaceae archaeon A-gly3]